MAETLPWNELLNNIYFYLYNVDLALYLCISISKYEL